MQDEKVSKGGLMKRVGTMLKTEPGLQPFLPTRGKDLRLKFWGVRGLTPVTPRTDDIEGKILSALRGASGVDLSNAVSVQEYISGLPFYIRSTVGGNTACVEVNAGRHLIVLDAGSGLRPLGLDLMAGKWGRGKGTVHIFLSHLGWDHIQGVPFFTPAYVPGNRIIFYSPFPELEQRLAEQQKFEHFPTALHGSHMKADKEFVRLEENQPLVIDGLRIHHTLLAYRSCGYRLEVEQTCLAYAPVVEEDASRLQEHLAFFQGVDILILDARCASKTDPPLALRTIFQAAPRGLFLFHYLPTHSGEDIVDLVEEAQDYLSREQPELQCDILAAQEGLEIGAGPERDIKVGERRMAEAAILSLKGRFDAHTASEIRDEIMSFIADEQVSKLVIDMSGVTQLSVAGLKVLLAARSGQSSTAIALAGLSNTVRQVLKLAGCEDFFAIYETTDAALDALEAREYLNLAGQTLKDRYRIEARLGQGGLGAVYKAFDTRLERPVAIKVLSSSLSEGATQRLLEEARSLARLNHPNVTIIYDSDQHEGKHYLVLEYVPGRTLREVIEGEPALSQEAIIDISLDLMSALEYAHSRGIVHRDLRPENVLIAEDRVKLMDFDLVRLESGKPLTEVPMFISSLDYMPPEQILGKGTDPRSDLYSFGIVLYELFTGRRPFRTDSDEALMQMQTQQRPASPRQYNPRLSRSMEHLILKLLEKNPDDRYDSAAQVREVLESLEIVSAIEGGGLFQTRRRKMVGREEEYQRLLERFKATLAGQGYLVFICGEAGIGKTMLAREVMTYARAEGATALIGHCYDLEGALPYQPFVEALRGYVTSHPKEVVCRHLGDVAAELVKLVPEIPQCEPALKAGAPLEPEQERRRLFDGVARFLRSLAQEKPLLLFLEDLHWADKASAQLLLYLVNNLQQMPVLVIVTFRDVELEEGNPFQETIQTLSRQNLYTMITLPRLSLAQVRAQLENIFEQPVNEGLATLIYKETEGNPFYVEEMVRALIEEKKLYRENGQLRWVNIESLEIPQSIRDLIVRRLRRLSESALKVMRVAAVIGQRFSFEVLRAVMEVEDEVVLDAIDEALRLRLIRDVVAEDVLLFSYGKIREVLYSQISRLRRRALHRKVGQVLEAMYRSSTNQILDQLAYHYVQGEDWEKAIEYLSKAGDKAESLRADDKALNYYQQALHILLKGQNQAGTGSQPF